jgi:DNA-binding NarL/FixJ family response regulator
MSLRSRISVAREQRKARKQKKRTDDERRKHVLKEKQHRYDRARRLTPKELARRVAACEFVDPKAARWARRAPEKNASKLVPRITKLSERDTELLALAADGWTSYQIASYWFKDPVSVRKDLRRIIRQLGAEQAS